MAKRHPKALGDVLTYLDGVGFDHLYVSRPSTGVPQARLSRDTGRAPSDQARARPAQTSAPPPAKQRAPIEAAPSPAAPPSETVPPATSLNGDGRAERFAQLRSEAESCRQCVLCETRKTVVFGSGNPDARLMLIGEGPGSEEDRQGLPFVGPAGALLTRIIEAIGFRRDQVYIANVVKCRPPRNRDPLPAEVQACRAYLEGQIDLVRPEVIVALGRVASQALLNSSSSLGGLRGRWHQVKGIDTRVTYHPAALLRYEKWKRPTWEDMKVVRDRLAGSS